MSEPKISGSTLTTFTTPYGVITIDTNADAKMARVFGKGAYPNSSLIEFARRATHDKSVVIDIGAHIGTFAVPIAKHVAQVIAFEPVASTYAILKQNVEQNNAHVDVRTVALGAKEDTASLLVRKAENAGANTLVPGGNIPVTTLDSEVEHADFIKIDVEGMEPEVFAGGMELIKRSRPIVWFELNFSQLKSHGASPRTLEEYFKGLKYNLYYLIKGEGKGGVLARVGSLTLLTTAIAPRAVVLGGESAPFDIIAISQEASLPLPEVGFSTALGHAFTNNLRVKARRFTKLFHA